MRAPGTPCPVQSTTITILKKGNLTPGLYFIRLDGTTVLSGKIIIE
jgi:hypothetical protein